MSLFGELIKQQYDRWDKIGTHPFRFFPSFLGAVEAPLLAEDARGEEPGGLLW